MPRYRVENTGLSSARFSGDVQLGNYTFSNVPSSSGAFLAKRTVEGENWSKALEKFYDELWPLLDALAFHRYSAVSSYGSSTVITKEGENVALVLLMDKRDGNGLWLHEGDLQQAEKKEILLLSKSNDSALSHFRVSMLATGANAVTLHLLQAAESLAGASEQSFDCRYCHEKLICKNCEKTHKAIMTDRGSLARLLGELYIFYYGKNSSGKGSYRNQLVHGYEVNEELMATKVEELYELIKMAIKKKYDLKYLRDVKGVKNLNTFNKFVLFIQFDKPLPPAPELPEMILSNQISKDTQPYRILFEKTQTDIDNF